MGYLTTIVIHNDALGSFEKDPKAFGEAILNGIDKANMNRNEESVSFSCYANYISVHPSRHADDEMIYIHKGNTVFELNPHSKDFKSFANHSPEGLNSFIKSAKWLIDYAKKEFEKMTEKKV